MVLGVLLLSEQRRELSVSGTHATESGLVNTDGRSRAVERHGLPARSAIGGGDVSWLSLHVDCL